MDDEGVVGLLVAVERLVAAHRDELDALNVFPVPDADTGRNVLATVRAARAAAEQARAGERRAHAVTGALRGARGNAGVLSSQLLRALVEEGDTDWAARLVRADELCRAAVAHPVEGSFLTAVREAATAAAGHGDAAAELTAAVAAAHAAVRDSPTLLEVLARAGVVDSGARAAALVLEALLAHTTGGSPSPPPVDVPVDGPTAVTCATDDERFEVMYLLEPEGDEEVTAAIRDGLDRIGGSVVVVAADRLVSVHVHTDDIGAAVDVGLAHGRPHNIRVEDLWEGTREAAARGQHPAHGAPRDVRVGLVVAADGEGVAQLAASTGATTLRLGRHVPTPDEVRSAIARTGRDRVVVLPSSPALAAVVRDLEDPTVEVVAAVDGPARLLAALAVLDPTEPDVDRLAAAAAAVREGAVRAADGRWTAVADGAADGGHDAPLAALGVLLDALSGEEEPELVSLLLGADVGVALRDAAASLVGHHWPDADLDVVDVGLERATFVVGVE